MWAPPRHTAALALLCLALAASRAAQQVAAIKVDCHPIEHASKEKCEALGCVWEPVQGDRKYDASQFGFQPPPSSLGHTSDGHDRRSRVGEPWCYFPDGYIGYKPLEETPGRVKLTRVGKSALGDDVQNLTISLGVYSAEGRIARLTVADSEGTRFQPELPEISLPPDSPAASSSSQFALKLERRGGSYLVSLVRVETGAVMFALDTGKLIFSDKFIQANSPLSSPFVYGLGEHYDHFLKYADRYKVYSFWNTDRLPLAGGTRSYGGFPFFVNLDSDQQTRAHGVYLRNSNAMDIVLQNDLSVTFRPIGGILDFFVFSGPTPNEVVQQFQQLVGLPELPARWSLGFHLCRYRYDSLEKTKLVWGRTRAAGIPFDVQWNDLDVMERANDFSYDNRSFAGLPEFVEELHAKNMHYIPLIDPGISQEPGYRPYELGTQMGVWIQNATKQTLVGRVWNQSGRTVFPDFSSLAAHQYWAQMFADYHKVVAFDGAWIDMNDISNFVDGSLDGCPMESAIEQPPYLPGGYSLQTHSLCLSAQHRAGREYDVHNLYSFYEAIATRKALNAARPGRRTLVISRSSHPGQGRYSGHWSGDVQSNWHYLRWSIPSLLEHSMYGFSMIGSDICGFAGNTTPQLCARWSTLGAFYTFSRNHNDDVSIDQDPAALGPEVVAANKNALTKRYSLLPHLYTLVYNAHKRGHPVARSLAFEFFAQNNQAAHLAEHQFMWGSALMVSPVVHEDTYNKSTYLPAGRWYETDILPESASFEPAVARAPKRIDVPQGGSHWQQTADIALTNLPLFYRGGHIVPAYARVGPTIADTERGQPIALEVALCQMGEARGELHLDDGETTYGPTNYLKMVADDKVGTLRVELLVDDFEKEVQFGSVKVWGLTRAVKKVTVHGREERPVSFKQADHMLLFDLGPAGTVTKDGALTVHWTY